MTTLAVEKLADLVKVDDKGHSGWPEFEALLKQHWQEIAKFKELMTLNPHLPRYLQIEREGRLHLVVMREDGRMVGYSMHLIVKGHPHYRHLTTAEDDIHYLVPKLRGRGAHEDMRVFALCTLAERGVHFVTARTKVGHPHETTLRRIGYVPFDMVYALNLTAWAAERKQAGETESCVGLESV
jgi:hypothetical protein